MSNSTFDLQIIDSKLSPTKIDLFKEVIQGMYKDIISSKSNTYSIDFENNDIFNHSDENLIFSPKARVLNSRNNTKMNSKEIITGTNLRFDEGLENFSLEKDFAPTSSSFNNDKFIKKNENAKANIKSFNELILLSKNNFNRETIPEE